jgi:hypothetical protein
MRRMVRTPSVIQRYIDMGGPHGLHDQRAPAPGLGEVRGGTDRVTVDRKTSTFFAFSDRLVRADAGNPNAARSSAPGGSEAGALRQPFSSSSLGGDHIELRVDRCQHGAGHAERRRYRRTTAADRTIAQCHSRRRAPERIAARRPGPLSKPGRWVLGLNRLEDRSTPYDGTLFRANVAKPYRTGRTRHLDTGEAKPDSLIACGLFRGSASRCRGTALFDLSV